MISIHRAKQILWSASFYVALAVLLLAVLFPFYWMFKTSLDSGEALFSYPPTFVPKSYDFHAYRDVINNTDIATWLWNSFIVSIGSTVLALAAGVSGAYGLSRFRYRGKSTLALVVLTTQMMPPLVLIIPIYTIYIGLNLTDTLFGLIIGNFAFSLPVVIWMMKSIFDTIPVEIEEAARVDGASWFFIMTRITLPIALPGLVAVSVFTFINGWDEFMFARTVVSATDKWVGTVGLASFIGIYVTPWDQILAAATIFTLPPVILFLLIQKHFMAGLGAGAVKG
ncbi:carbohydrate ABC transporter permease [Mesorhizobium sp.]|uniref:carbohydrate ABC transporter permease n=1 Tax=Mesorhizobium sp. TaxID=1871066 RepID=UPI0012234647|nr:carbohydrate ABC transporter permease [Mesorhizobium sp.]TIU42715.1 MAG: carbohydrate ABC transporter permease [Mesorhizobium sp.]TIV62399.1 MAG: carbohydrate ABC transporter permease [Mesorhizobium sp.]